MTYSAGEVSVLIGVTIVVLALIAAVLERRAISHFLHVLLTEDDANLVWCWARVAGFIGLIAYIVFCAIDLVWNHNAFNPLTFGGGLAGVIGAGAGAIRLKGNL